jgi:hypothetical protein
MDWVIAQKKENPNSPFVANMSLGGENVEVVDAAAQRMWDAGIFVVAAAGNEYTDACSISPGRTPAIITVGAIDREDNKADFSNYGRCVDIFAPGKDIFSASMGTRGGIVFSGTSMAAPHVAGAVALILSKYPQASLTDVESILKKRSLRGAVANIDKAAIENLLLRIEEPSLAPGDTTPQPIPEKESPTFEFQYETKVGNGEFKNLITLRDQLPVNNVAVRGEFVAPLNAAISLSLFRLNDSTKKFELIATQERTGADAGKIIWSGPVGMFQWQVKSGGYAGTARVMTSFHAK